MLWSICSTFENELYEFDEISTNKYFLLLNGFMKNRYHFYDELNKYFIKDKPKEDDRKS